VSWCWGEVTYAAYHHSSLAFGIFTVHGEAVVEAVELVLLALYVVLMLLLGTTKALEGCCCPVGRGYPVSVMVLLEAMAGEPSDAGLESLADGLEGARPWEAIEDVFVYSA
jgi:hypothetical protein